MIVFVFSCLGIRSVTIHTPLTVFLNYIPYQGMLSIRTQGVHVPNLDDCTIGWYHGGKFMCSMPKAAAT